MSRASRGLWGRRMLTLAVGLALLVGSYAGSAYAEEVEYVLAVESIGDFAGARKAKAAVSDLGGIKSVDVDSMKGSMTVVFDDSKRSVSEIVTALSTAGFSVSTFDKQ